MISYSETRPARVSLLHTWDTRNTRADLISILIASKLDSFESSWVCFFFFVLVLAAGGSIYFLVFASVCQWCVLSSRVVVAWDLHNLCVCPKQENDKICDTHISKNARILERRDKIVSSGQRLFPRFAFFALQYKRIRTEMHKQWVHVAHSSWRKVLSTEKRI